MMSLERGSCEEGGCLCGRVRYRVTGNAFDALHCHCSDCRKASGAPFLSWAGFRGDQFEWVQGTPGEIVIAGRRRGFCVNCGTQLTFQYLDRSDVEVTLASMDDPARVVPLRHEWVEDKISWIQFADGLPVRQRGDEMCE